MARNRKRAKERRARRPQPVGRPARQQSSGAPSPLEQAAPDAELAEQAELPPDHELQLSAEDEAEFEEEAEESAEEYEEEVEAEPTGGSGGRGLGRRGGGDLGGDGGGELAVPSGAGPISERRPRTGSRLLTFLQGSWAELQRVQWPDRRQVMQATGVVIGFVIVAGLFLGAADWAAKHLINYILQGRF
jgi:preprotein translocase SecE subunit